MTLAPLTFELAGVVGVEAPRLHAADRRRRDGRTAMVALRPGRETIELSVVIPAHNEELRLPASLATIRGNLEKRPELCEMIVVDDGSTDRTSEVAENAGARVIRLPVNAGKGAAVRAGVSQASGRLILISDADLSTPFGEYETLRQAVERGASVAIASRVMAGARITQPQPLHRRAMGRVFNRMVQALVLPGIQDTQCGFKLFRAEIARAAFGYSKVDGFAFDVEVLSIVHSLGGTISEVPVEWGDSPNSTVRPFSDVPQMLLELIRIRRQTRPPHVLADQA